MERRSKQTSKARKSRKILGIPILGFLLAGAAGSIFGLGSYTFQYGEGLSYFSKDPAACVNCHIMQPQYDSWQKASHHAAATCVECHLPHDFVGKYISKAENGYLHSKGFTFQDFPEPIVIRDKAAEILQQNCIACHQDFVHEMINDSTAPAEDIHCVHCHRTVGHGERVGLGKIEDVPNLIQQPK